MSISFARCWFYQRKINISNMFIYLSFQGQRSITIIFSLKSGFQSGQEIFVGDNRVVFGVSIDAR